VAQATTANHRRRMTRSFNGCEFSNRARMFDFVG
jgi:hypothetical protein